MSGNHPQDHAQVHAKGDGRGRLLAAASLNTGFAVVQVLVGVAIGSVVVLADAAHQVVDALGLLTALGSVMLAARPSSPQMSFGWGKADALGGLLSGLLLLGSVAWIAYESTNRLFNPVEVDGGGVVTIGLIAIAVNGISVLALSTRSGAVHSHSVHSHSGQDHSGQDHSGQDHSGQDHSGHGHASLSLCAARLHLLTDLAGSFLVVFAGLILVGSDLTWIDPTASLLLCLLVLRSTWSLMTRASHELLDRVPTNVTIEAVTSALTKQPGVERVHHVHVRPLGQNRASITAHVVVEGDQTLHDAQAQIGALGAVLERQLGVAHSTIQLECHPCDEGEC